MLKMLEGSKTYLRPLERHDALRLLQMRITKSTRTNYMGYPFPITETEESNWLETLYGDAFPTRIYMGIIDKGNDTLSGFINLREISWIHRRGMLGILIHEEDRGKGLAKDATIVFLGYLFNEIGLRKIFLEVLEGNTGAIKLYESIGFHREGLLKDHVFVEGNFCNIIIMALLCNNFLAQFS